MRWKERQHLDTKIKTVFLWFPKLLDGETRWLEYATIKYNYSYNYGFWYDFCFLNTDKVDKKGNLISNHEGVD